MRRIIIGIVLLAAPSVPVKAQSAGKVAIGGSVGTRIAPSSTVGGDKFGWGLLWRIGHSKEGFGWEGGLNWFTANVEHAVGGTPAFRLGEVHVRPLMVGHGYTHLVGPTAIKQRPGDTPFVVRCGAVGSGRVSRSAGRALLSTTQRTRSS
jgi:hypothetical protein